MFILLVKQRYLNFKEFNPAPTVIYSHVGLTYVLICCGEMFNFFCCKIQDAVQIKKFSDLPREFFSFIPSLLNTVFNNCVQQLKIQIMNPVVIHRLLIKSADNSKSAHKFNALCSYHIKNHLILTFQNKTGSNNQHF